VIAVARSADAILIVLDAGKEGLQKHREILERELETVGIRLNQTRPDVTLSVRKSGGGVRFASTVPQPHLGPEPEKLVTQILREYKISAADVSTTSFLTPGWRKVSPYLKYLGFASLSWIECQVLAREEITVDQLVDVVQGNREYKPCLYLYNKIDTVTIEEIDELARMPYSIVGSVAMAFNISADPLEDDLAKQKIWEYLGLTRIYTKRKGTWRGDIAYAARSTPNSYSLLTDLNYTLGRITTRPRGTRRTLSDQERYNSQIVVRKRFFADASGLQLCPRMGDKCKARPTTLWIEPPVGRWRRGPDCYEDSETTTTGQELHLSGAIVSRQVRKEEIGREKAKTCSLAWLASRSRS
jgi:hypothetical protein